MAAARVVGLRGVDVPGGEGQGSPQTSDDLDARIQGLRERLPGAQDSDTNILVKICEWLERVITAVIAKIKQLWNAVFGAAASEAEGKDGPGVRSEGPIPTGLIKQYLALKPVHARDKKRIGEWKGDMLQQIGSSKTDRFDASIRDLFDCYGLSDAQVVAVVKELMRSAAEAGDLLRGNVSTALDVALNKNRWLHFLKWMHDQDKCITTIQTVNHNCMLSTSVWNIAPIARPGEQYTADSLRTRMFRDAFVTLVRERDSVRAREFREMWLNAISEVDPMGQDPIPIELVPKMGWERNLFIRYGIDLITDEEYRIRSFDTEDIHPRKQEMDQFFSNLTELVEKYKKLQLSPQRENGELELYILPHALERAVVLYYPDGELDQKLRGTPDREGDQTVEQPLKGPLQLLPVEIFGAEHLPPFGAAGKAPLPLCNLSGSYYMGMRYVAPEA